MSGVQRMGGQQSSVQGSAGWRMGGQQRSVQESVRQCTEVNRAMGRGQLSRGQGPPLAWERTGVTLAGHWA